MHHTNGQPSKQFSLKRMFVATALVAGCASYWREEPVAASILAMCLTCFVAATIGLRCRKPVLGGAIGGVLYSWVVVAISAGTGAARWSLALLAVSGFLGSAIGSYIGLVVQADEQKRLGALRDPVDG